MDEECVRLVEHLARASVGCLPSETIRVLERVSTRACSGEAGDSEVVEVQGPEGLRLVLPVAQLPEAWHNILHIYCYRDYEVLRGFTPRPGWRVVDIGCYLGFYSLRAAQLLQGEGLVVCVEPNPLAREFAYRNLELNSMERVARVDPRAIGCREGLATLTLGCYWANSSLLEDYVEEASGVCGRARVRLATIETLLDSHSLDHVELVKIDIEGAEGEVLECTSIGPSRARRLVVEVHPPYASPEKIIQTLRSRGYKVAVRSVTETQTLVYAWAPTAQ